MGEDVRIVFRNPDRKKLLRQIMSLNPVLVGFGSLYPELKEKFAVNVTGADFGVIGEGEIILHQLVTALRAGKDVSSVKGLVIRYGDETVTTGPGEFIKDLSKLPAIPYDLFPAVQWLPIGRWYAANRPQPHWRFDDRVVNVHGGRGCPFQCNFCYHHSKPRYRSIPLMIAEGAEALDRFNGNMLYFSDDLVLASPKRAQALVGAIGSLKKPIEYSVSARFDILAQMDDELLHAMKETGCRIMGLGIESGSDRILGIIGKNCTSEMILNGLERLKKVGILPTVSIMVGQYTETREDVEDSIELMRKSVRSNPNIQYAFTITTPFPGSQLYKLIFDKKYLHSHMDFYKIYFSTSNEWQQVVNLSAMGDEEVIMMHRKIKKAYHQEKTKALGPQVSLIENLQMILGKSTRIIDDNILNRFSNPGRSSRISTGFHLIHDFMLQRLDSHRLKLEGIVEEG
jgi:radical SAM superfamily enzyme YgiQ (UPF0313 family)